MSQIGDFLIWANHFHSKHFLSFRHMDTKSTQLQLEYLCEFYFQSRDLEDWETQEATMSVCMYVSVSQKIIRFKSMNSSDKI